MEKKRTTSRRLILFCIVLGGAVFAFDLMIPLGVAGGVPYVAVVLASTWSPKRSFTVVVAAAASALTMLGMLLSPAGGVLWVVLLNRFLALFAIWLTALLMLRFKRMSQRETRLRARTEQSVEVLRETQERLCLVLDQIPAILWTTDPELRFNSSLGSGLLALKLKSGDLDGLTLFEHFGTTDPEFAPIAAHLRALRGESATYEHQAEQATYQVRVQPLHDRSKQIIGCIGVALDVTKSKVAEDALQESERRFRTTFESAAIAMALDDEDGKLLETNPAFQRLFGYTSEELEGKSFRELTHPEDVDLGWKQFQETVAGARDRFRVEKRYLSKDGTLLWGSVDVSAIRDAEGRFRHTVAMVQDITARKRAEKSLRDSEERFRQLTEHITEAFWLTDWTKRQVLYLSPAYEEIWGKSRESLYENAQSWADIIHPEDRDRVVEAFERDAERDAYDVEYRIIRPDGELRWIHDRAFPIRDDSGKVYRMAGISHDITARKRAEETLRFTQFAMDHNSDATYWVKKDGTIFYANHAACQALGYTYEELTSMTVPDIDPDFPHHAWADHWQAMKEARSTTFEAHHRTKTGRIVPVEILSNFLEYDGREYICAFVRDITQRRATEVALKDSEARYHDLYDNAPDMFCSVDVASGRVLECNQTLAAMTGYTKNELIGRHISELYHPDSEMDRQDVFKAFSQFGEVRDAELQLQRKDGGKLDVSLNVSAVRDEQGNILRSRSIWRDITDRKHAEEALRESEAMHRSLVESTNAVPWKVDLASGRFTYIGPQVVQLLGYPLSSWVDIDTWSDRVHPEDREAATKYCNIATARGDDHAFEYRAVAADGSIVWIRNFVSVIVGNRGPEELIGFMFDITERKRAEEVKIQLATALDSAGEAIMITDVDGVIQYVNSAFERIHGYTREEVIGKNPRLFKSGWQDDGFYHEMWATLLRGEVWRGSLVNRAKDGTLIDLEETIAPVRASLNSAISFVAVERDITERKRSERRARQQEAALAHVARLNTMGEMATGLAHELNQPLAAVVNLAEACIRRLQSEAPQTDKVLKNLEEIAQQGQRAGEIIRRLKEFTGRGEPKRTATDINTVVREASQFVAGEARANQVTIHLKLAESPPAVSTDAVQIGQVVLNLARNAIDSMAENGQEPRELTIQTSTDRDHRLEVAVTDTGPGISKETLPKVFDPFFTTKTEGMGMGLSISRTIIEAHEGRIWVTQNPDRGVTMRFSLPIPDRSVQA